ncbi:MAG: hypothetical protein ACFFA6_08995 [Promethearchaeota archaeon]
MKSFKKFIKFEKGTIPLIFSVPHGGKLKCDEIPTRKSGILGIDKGTIKLTQKLMYYLKKYSKKKNLNRFKPSYVFSNVPRSKIDLNREEIDAYEHRSKLAEKIYHRYHNKIEQYISENLEVFNTSLLIDIHGFEKTKRPSGFRDVELILGTNNLESFFSEPVSKRYWKNTIRGKIIKRFLKLKIPIAPGHPRRREYVLTGGYTIQKYGSSQILKSKTMQIEFSDRIRIYEKKLRKIVLRTLAEIIIEEFNLNLN